MNTNIEQYWEGVNAYSENPKECLYCQGILYTVYIYFNNFKNFLKNKVSTQIWRQFGNKRIWKKLTHKNAHSVKVYTYFNSQRTKNGVGENNQTRLVKTRNAPNSIG